MNKWNSQSLLTQLEVHRNKNVSTKHDRLSTSGRMLVITKRFIVGWLLKISRSIRLPLISRHMCFYLKEHSLTSSNKHLKVHLDFRQENTSQNKLQFILCFPKTEKHHNSNSIYALKTFLLHIFRCVFNLLIFRNEFQDTICSN